MRKELPEIGHIAPHTRSLKVIGFLRLPVSDPCGPYRLFVENETFLTPCVFNALPWGITAGILYHCSA